MNSFKVNYDNLLKAKANLWSRRVITPTGDFSTKGSSGFPFLMVAVIVAVLLIVLRSE